MFKKKVTMISLMVCFLLIVSSSSWVFADTSDKLNDVLSKEGEVLYETSLSELTEVIGNEQIKKLKSIYETAFSKKNAANDADVAFRDVINSIYMQAEANDLTDEQINSMIAGYIDSTEDALTKDLMIYSDTPPVAPPSHEMEDMSKSQITSDPVIYLGNDDKSSRSSYENDGVGYEVRSLSNFKETTAFAKVGSSNITQEIGSAAYMFYTVYHGGNYNDYGITYFNNKWQVFVSGYWTNWGTGTPKITIKAGDELYFMVTIENQKVRLRILSADFKNVYWDQFYTTWEQIPNSGSGVTFNRQVTVTDNDHRTDSGHYILNARFYNSFLYTTSSNAKYNDNNTQSDRRGKFGSPWAPDSKVNVVTNTHWDSETISITIK